MLEYTILTAIKRFTGMRQITMNHKEELLAGGPNAQNKIKQLFAQLSERPVTDSIEEVTAQTISRVRKVKEAKKTAS
jgi:hypothetical protein